MGVCASAGAVGAEDAGYYEGDENDRGEPHGRGSWHFPNGDIFSGEWSYGAKVKGRFTYKNGDYYEGTFTKGMFHGEGEMVSVDGTSYKGGFSQGRFAGHGEYVDSNHNVYEGAFLNGVQHGRGKMTFTDTGDVYEGQWEGGMRHGEGKLTYRDDYFGRRYYTGQWANDRKSNGTLHFRHNGRYKGEWGDNKYHGAGELVLANKDVYRGHFHMGSLIAGRFEPAHKEYIYDGEFDKKFHRSGQGKCIYKNGNVYIGRWRNDMKDGKGKLSHPDGLVLDATFAQDMQQDGIVHIEFADHSIYEGESVQGQPSGTGTLTLTDGNVYEGDFMAGKQHGQGTIYWYRDGDGHKLQAPEICTGVWEKGKLRGVDEPNLRLAALKMASERLVVHRAMHAEALEALKQKGKGLKNICIACHKQTVNTIFLECAHFVHCEDCAENLQQCPVCNQQIMRIQKTYQS